MCGIGDREHTKFEKKIMMNNYITPKPFIGPSGNGSVDEFNMYCIKNS